MAEEEVDGGTTSRWWNNRSTVDRLLIDDRLTTDRRRIDEDGGLPMVCVCFCVYFGSLYVFHLFVCVFVDRVPYFLFC